MEEAVLFQGEFTQIARLWKRAIASVADAFVLLLPTAVVLFIYFLIMFNGNFENISQAFTAEDIRAILVLRIIPWIIFLSYFTYFIGKTGQTPGKKAIALKVVNSEGNAIGYKKAFLRSLFFIIYGLGNIGLIIFITSIIFAIIDKQKRALHDRACKTFVISKDVEGAIEKIRQEGKPCISGPAIFAFGSSGEFHEFQGQNT